MKDKRLPRTGIAFAEDSEITFYLNDYVATFMCANSKKHVFCKNEDFIFGRTYEHHTIAISKKGIDLPVNGSKQLNTDSYIVAKYNAARADMSGFDRIEFIGGTLNRVFYCNALESDDNDISNPTFHLQDDTLTYDVDIENIPCKLKIHSDIRESFGDSGRVLSNDKAILSIEFPHKQPLNSVYKHIAKIKELLAFMTFRRNVGFESITLYHNSPDLSPMEVFIKEVQAFTEKNIFNNITFDSLKDSIPALLSILYGSKEDKPSYELGFIPTSDKDIRYMTNNKIRLICSSLECEMSFVKDLDKKEDQNLEKLITDVKALIKSHRKTPDKLSQKTYDNIFNNISHWSMSASDKMCLLYHRHEQEILKIALWSQRVDDEKIDEFVKYRNKITHGSWRVLSDSVASTAHVLQSLVYCCILTRIGMSKEQICTLCENYKMLN